MFRSDKKEMGMDYVSQPDWITTPDDIALEIANNYLSAKEAVQWAQCGRSIFETIKPELKLKKLVQHIIVKPNEDIVTAILTLEPELVDTVINEVIDTSGRIHRLLRNNTIFQLAYGAGDDAMCLAMKPSFIKVYGSEEAGIQEMERQRNEKFAENKEEDERKDNEAKDHFASLLGPVIEAITLEQFNSGKDDAYKLILSAPTLAAINTFREEFVKSQPKIIEKGMHFRVNTLLEAYNAYAQTAAEWGYDYNKCALFEDGVLSCVLLCVPANDAQKFSQGLYYLQEKNEKCKRSLMLRDGSGSFYLVAGGPSARFSLSGGYINAEGGAAFTGTAAGVGPSRRCIKTYVEQKHQTCRAYAVTTTAEVSVCVVKIALQ